ncbi:MAG: sugar phosphate nucleotidyltransferase [Candidatus Azobacteroides sp.]|nr:sugar phosphate nucleotidyltransferase [Candidatus Azobacteroides sp.]
MHYAIIAAGEGSRLLREGMSLPKPLVRLGEKAMIDRLIGIFVNNKARSVSVIVNEQMVQLQKHLSELNPEIPLNIVVKSTPSSMHSFYELSSFLHDDKFCLTTVDTIFREDEFSRYIDAFSENDDIDGLMAVTSYIDDEKPLFVNVDDRLKINGFTSNPGSKYISGGIYCLSPNVLPVLKQAVENGMSRMRNFQQQMVESGFHLQAFPFEKIIDVDHIEDIKKAEKFIYPEE